MLNPHILTPFVPQPAQAQPEEEYTEKVEPIEKIEKCEANLQEPNDDSLDKIQKYNEFLEDISSPTPEEDTAEEPKVGKLSQTERDEKIKRYLEKKQRRKTVKPVRYACRQKLAEKRFRHKGKFVKAEDLPNLDPKNVYNPKIEHKPIFRTMKDPSLRLKRMEQQ